MAEKFQVPVFEHEADEAQWWFDNRERLAEQFELAASEGKLGRGAAEMGGNAPTATIRLDPVDVSKARMQAERRGVEYQTYLIMLIHEALQREDIMASLPPV